MFDPSTLASSTITRSSTESMDESGQIHELQPPAHILRGPVGGVVGNDLLEIFEVH